MLEPCTLLPLLEQRYSPRAFDPNRGIAPAELRTILDAARRSPSAYNEQPWRFIVATREAPETFAALLSCLVEQNQAWARHAAALVFTIARTSFTHNGQENRHALHDVGIATMSLITQAAHLGLHAHVMAGFDAARAREVLRVPEGFEPVTAVALGHVGSPDLLSDELRARELRRTPRRPLEETVFTGAFDVPFA